MELAVINKLETLPVKLQAYALNRIGKKSIRDLHPNQIRESCSKVINLAFVESGQIKQATQQMLDFNRDSLIGELTGRFKDLTLEELSEAFKMGIRGEFGEYFGLCAATYHKFIKSYFERPERAESMRVYLDSIKGEIVKEKPTPEQQHQIMLDGCREALKDFKETKRLPYSPAPYYDFLWKELKLINWTDKEKEEIKKEAKLIYESKVTKQKQERRINTQQAKDLLSNLGANQSFINTVKQVGLKRFFEQTNKI